jgi:hypothetical protein
MLMRLKDGLMSQSGMPHISRKLIQFHISSRLVGVVVLVIVVAPAVRVAQADC